MPIYCWIKTCHHNNMKNQCKFFRFPKLEKDMVKWLKLIKRSDRPSDADRICSCHFKDGKKENGPGIFEENVETFFQSHYLTPEKRKTRKRLMADQPSTSFANVDEDIQPLAEAPQEQTQTEGEKPSYTVLEAELYLLKLQLERKEEVIADLSSELKILSSRRPQMSYAHIIEKNKLVLEYTGLPTKEIFNALLLLVKSVEITYYLPWKVERLSTEDQLLLTLMKLRQNFPHADLSYRFGISTAAVTNVVITFIHVLYEILYQQLMDKVPSRNKNRSCLPNCASSFTNCRIIIDCTDVNSAVPRQSMKQQRMTYSSYKHRNTLKGLVGVAPNGVVTFVSSLYPGSTSDKAIVDHCGIVKQMVSGDLIIADKGFLIRDLLPEDVAINIPPFLCRPQFSREEIRLTQCIARARIHVERAIQRMKCYKILNFIPKQLFPYASIIFKTVGAITNLQYPLIREVSEFYIDNVDDIASELSE